MASYGSVEGVSALIPGVGDIDTTSTPTEAEVSRWLDEGYGRINRALSAKGYSVPISSTALIYDELTGLNNMWAQIILLRARGLDTIQGTEQDKARQLMEEFKEHLQDLCSSDLSAFGVTVATGTTGNRRRSIRSVQLRRVDGYSGEYSGDIEEYDTVSD